MLYMNIRVHRRVYIYANFFKTHSQFLLNSTTQHSEKRSTDLSHYWYIFVVAQLLSGVGSVSIYTLGTAFLDESVPSHQSSVYLGTQIS